MAHTDVKEIIFLKLYGDVYACVHVHEDNDRTLVVRRCDWSRDEALLLADFITQNVR